MWLAVEVAWVLDGVLVFVVESNVESEELDNLWIGGMVDFLAANENQLFKIDFPVVHRSYADSTCPSPLDDTDTRHVDIAEFLECRQGGSNQGQVDRGGRS